MARYKPYDLNQSKMIPLSYADQVVEGSFEHALNEIVEQHLELSAFEQRYANDTTGRLAYDPKVLLKIRALWLLQGHPLEPSAGRSVPPQCGVYGAFRGHAAALHHARGVRQ